MLFEYEELVNYALITFVSRYTRIIHVIYVSIEEMTNLSLEIKIRVLHFYHSYKNFILKICTYDMGEKNMGRDFLRTFRFTNTSFQLYRSFTISYPIEKLDP